MLSISRKRRFEPFGAANIVAGGKHVRGINANADIQITAAFEDRFHLFELPAERRSLPRGIFEQNFQIAELQAAQRLPQTLDDCAHGRVAVAFAAASRMDHEIVRAESERSHNFLVKCLHGARPQNGIGRGQIDQVVSVDDERPERQFLAAIAESRRVRFGDSRCVAFAPHARAGGKNLQGVCAEAVRNFERAGDVARDGGVDADANAAVFPSGNFRGGRRFRTVFVGVVES